MDQILKDILTRKTALQTLEAFFAKHHAPSIKSVRIDYAPFDKKGEISDLVITAFTTSGAYDMYFVKRARLPLHSPSKEEFSKVVSTCLTKILAECKSLLEEDENVVREAIQSICAEVVENEERKAEQKLPMEERLDRSFQRLKDNGTLDRVLNEQKEEKERARQKLDAAFAEFDAMTDEAFHELVMNEVNRCNSDEYATEMLPEWTARRIQFDVTERLHDVVALIMQRGPEKTPAWGEKDKKEFDQHGFHCEFHSYRGLTVRFDSCAVDSGHHLFKDDGTHLIMT